ncbi:TIGR02611 family protein [Planococcus sp. APC 4015]|nr:TIGR02611 family protein [Planococcus sp. APC 4015]
MTTSPDGGLESSIRADIADAQRSDRPVRRALRRARSWVSRHPRIEVFYRAGVGVVGTVLTLGGLLLVPLPGPGWLVVFVGLAVLGTEFAWAHRMASALKRVLDRFWSWVQTRRARRTAQRADVSA